MGTYINLQTIYVLLFINKSVEFKPSFPVVRMLTFICTVLFSIAATARPATDSKHPVADTIKISSSKKQLPADSVKKYLTIHKILIVGNNLTRKTIILRELRLKEGDVVSES